MDSTSMEKILKILYNESPLSPKVIAERLEMNTSTVRVLLSHAKSLGAVTNYKKIRGLFILTPYGKRLVQQKLKEDSEDE